MEPDSERRRLSTFPGSIAFHQYYKPTRCVSAPRILAHALTTHRYFQLSSSENFSSRRKNPEPTDGRVSNFHRAKASSIFFTELPLTSLHT